MIINDYKPTVESSGSFKESMFSVSDMGMIFDILRNKLYSNPIAAVCRELSCNARDTHRAAGKQNEPISIQLPNVLEPFLKIKDVGEGISPDRMEHIFIKYAASTKREDNLQTGGWGIGAKSAFSYSDSFIIVTVFDKVKYSYSALIDETKVGKMILMSEEPTSEQNGTEIVIPVKDADHRLFAAQVEFATRHWDVKPKISGANLEYTVLKERISGSNWKITENNYYNQNVKLIIDGIEYPLDINELSRFSKESTEFIYSFYGDLYLYFNNGDLSLSANRESVYLDDRTKNKIVATIKQVIAEFSKNLEDKVSVCKDLWEANLFYNDTVVKLFRNNPLQVQWQGCNLTRYHLSTECMVSNFTKGAWSRKTQKDEPEKISRKTARQVVFVPHCALVMNDLEPFTEVTAKYIKDLFSDTVKLVQVINPGSKDAMDEMIKEFNLDKMNLLYLSDYTDLKIKKKKIIGSRLNTFKFNPINYSFEQIPYKDAEECTDTKILCRFVRDGNNKNVKLKNGKFISSNVIHNLQLFHQKTQFFAVDYSVSDDKIEECFSEFITIDDFVQEKVIDNKQINYIEVKYALNTTYSYNSVNLEIFKLEWKDVPEDSIFKICHSKINKILNLAKYSDLLSLYEQINGYIPDSDITNYLKTHEKIDVLASEALRYYPMLKLISRYDFVANEKTITDYIKLVDERKE